MKLTAIVAAVATLGLCALTACVTTQHDQVIIDSAREAAKVFAEEYHAATTPPKATLQEAGVVSSDNWAGNVIPTEWGYAAEMEGTVLFKVTMDKTMYFPDPPDESLGPLWDPAPLWTDLSISTVGIPSRNNPVSGSAIWSGGARAVWVEEVEGTETVIDALEGRAFLEADFSTATIDLHLAGHELLNHSWTNIPMTSGSFTSWNEGNVFFGPAEVAGKFYGAAHQGVAGSFAFIPTLTGVFGAVRE